MKPFLYGLTATLFLIHLFPTHSQAQETPQGVLITEVNAIGNGCRPGAVSSSISPDSKELSLLFDDFISNAGGNTISSDKKICVITVRLVVPDGWSMGLLSADYRGFAAIDAGAQGQHEVLYSFNKDYAGSSFSSSVMRGPTIGNYYIRNTLRQDQVNWSACGNRNVDLTVRVGLITQILGGARGRPTAQITLDSVDTSTRQNFVVGWRRCAGPQPNPLPTNPGGSSPTRPPTYEPGGSNGLTSIYQMWNGVTRYYTFDSRLAERGTWFNQGIAFQVSAQASRVYSVALFQCLNGGAKYFLSTDRSCEGQRLDRQLGFISSVPSAGLVLLGRYVNRSDINDRLATTNAANAAGLQFERWLGYVMK